MTAKSNYLDDARADRGGHQRSVTVFLDVSGYVGHYSFVATGVSLHRPLLIDACDLRSALRVSKSLEPDHEGRTPLPILLIDARSANHRPPIGRDRDEAIGEPRDRGVRSLPSATMIASLLLDCSLIGLADGALVVVDPETHSTSTLLNEVTNTLKARGVEVSTQIEGWELRRGSSGNDAPGDCTCGVRQTTLA